MRDRIRHHRANRSAISRRSKNRSPSRRALKVDEARRYRSRRLPDALDLELLMANRGGREILDEARALAATMAGAPFASIVVTDEVGAGIVPGERDGAALPRPPRMDQPDESRKRRTLGADGRGLSYASNSRHTSSTASSPVHPPHQEDLRHAVEPCRYRA